MHRHFNSRLNKNVAIIHPGEYLASGEDLYISTVLGSCIAVAFYDGENHLGGLNHFMLPGSLDKENYLLSESGKYGMYAMELLINDLLKLGAKRSNLRAKVFGGGHVLSASIGNNDGVPKSNITFAFEYLRMEGFPIDSSDVGGTIARKIFFDPRNAKVLLKRITGKLIVDVEKEEEDYLETIRKRKEAEKARDEPTLF
ncbi:MAG: chemotaxis protein CheD [Spirochaetes bacterium]|jgi:chemotaxis protein CheD|nr:chemotaxis protein CheD [Spirochaetota bacterium]